MVDLEQLLPALSKAEDLEAIAELEALREE